MTTTISTSPTSSAFSASPPNESLSPNRASGVTNASATKYRSTSMKKTAAKGPSTPIFHVLIAVGDIPNGVGDRTQFVREEIFAIAANRRPPTKSGRPREPKASARAVIGEAIREGPEFCRHVLHPQPPRPLWGKRPDELLAWYVGLVEAAKLNTEELTSKGRVFTRRQRSTVPILLASVASFPGPPDDMNRDYRRWRLHVVAWAKRRYGNRLVSVIEHVDERHGHIHIIAANPNGTPARLIHAGYAAVAKAKAAGAVSSTLGEVYRGGCRELQDDFWRRVGRKCCLDRISAEPQSRLAYSIAKARRSLEDQRQQYQAELAEDRSALLKQQSEANVALAIRAAMVKARESQASAQEAELAAAVHRTLDVARRNSERRVELEAREAAVVEREDEVAEIRNNKKKVSTAMRSVVGAFARAVRIGICTRADAIAELAELGIDGIGLLAKPTPDH